MSSESMPQRKDAHIRSEVNGLSKDEVVLTGGAFVSAEVVGKTASGLFTKLDLDPEATEANEAAGVVYGYYDATAADVTGLAHVRLTAVEGSLLVFPDAATPTQKAAFLDQLEALNIIVR